MASESSQSSASSPSPSNQPGAIVASETDPTDFLRKDAGRRVFLRLWHGMRARRGPLRRSL